MKRITSFEIRCLKGLLEIYRDRNAMLSIENEELRKQLEESRAKEGKGCLEKAVDAIGNTMKSICDVISGMNPDELESLIIQNNDEEDGDSDAI